MSSNKPKILSNGGSRTYLISGEFIKFHTVFKDGTEIVEEYSLYSEEIESRRVKKVSMTGKENWTTEIGEEIRRNNNEDFLIKVNNDNNPIFIRKDTKENFEFRIRNLKGDADNFLVDIDKDKDEIVIRTKNKKYYKRFNIPDLKRLNLNLNENNLKVNFSNNVLVITYKKPIEILNNEKEIIDEIRKIREEIKKNPEKKYEPGCQNQ
jgi:hypothetical protein